MMMDMDVEENTSVSSVDLFSSTHSTPQRIRGENNCPAFAKTKSPCIDLLYSVVPGTKNETLKHILNQLGMTIQT